jgi:hypothetical protein
MRETRELTPKREDMLNELDKKFKKKELTETEWEKAIRSILLSKA